MNIWPSSPVWADIARDPIWNENVHIYDSGARQGSTNRTRPLYRYEITAKNYNESVANSLEAFFNSLQGRVTPFLFKDPYQYVANAVTQPSTTTMGNGSGFYLVQGNSWRIIPDSAFLAISCGRSGALVAGSHYVASLDNGWIQTKVAPSSIWTASFQYFRKVAFESGYASQSPIWNIFNASIVIQELIPS